MSSKNDDTKKEPIVFPNSPIEDMDQDVLGIDSHVDFIDKAIERGATIIGIVADYGTGKSTITEELSRKERYDKYIRINLWDAIDDKSFVNRKSLNEKKRVDKGKDGAAKIKYYKNEKKDITINVLIKSFVFQLGNKISKSVGNHVNKMLSDNYNTVSFSVGNHYCWLLFILATLFLAAFFVLGPDSLNALDNGKLKSIILFCRPLMLAVGGALLVWGLKYTHFMISKFEKMDGRRIEVNELFAAYSYVNGKLVSEHKKAIIVIEDLDRINNDDRVHDFLVELYRLNNIIENKEKNKKDYKEKDNHPVFIVAISRQILSKYRDVFTKIFDYEVDLHTIHIDDFRDVLKEIFKNNKEEANSLLDVASYDSKEQLLDDCSWLYKDENLTIRELKDRLNKTIEKYFDLKYKQYQGVEAISFERCAAVTFLEKKYPDFYDELIKKEKEFSNIITRTYEALRESRTIDCQYVKDEFGTVLDNLSDMESFESKFTGFANTLAEMINKRLLDSDYRMYFYAYPKGSYIKSVEEKEICEYLELPNIHKYKEEELIKKIKKARGDNKTVKIEETIERISNNDRIDSFDKVVFEDEYLFDLSTKYGKGKTIVTVKKLLSNISQKNIAIKILGKLKTYNNFNNDYKTSLIDSIFDDYSTLTSSEITWMRGILIEVFGDDILGYKKLFYNEGDIVAPLLSGDEIDVINNKKVAVELIDVSNISEDNVDHIQSLLCNIGEVDDIKEKLIEIQNRIIDVKGLEKTISDALEFMKNSKIVDEELFELICDSIEEDDLETDGLAEYLNALNVDDVPESYYKKIEEMILYINISDQLLDNLVSRKMYSSSLIIAEENNKLDHIRFFEDNEIEPIKESLLILNDNYNGLIESIRLYMLKQNSSLCRDHYSTVFFGDFSIVKQEELDSIEVFQVALDLIDWQQISNNNYEYIVTFFNKEKRVGEDCYILLTTILTKKFTNTSILSMVYNGLDFDVIDFSSLSENEKQKIVDCYASHYTLTSGNQAKTFMLQVKSVVPSLEEIVRVKLGIEEYNKMLNEIGEISSSSKKFILEDDPQYGYVDSITDVFLNEGHKEHYIVSKVLYNKKLNYPLEGVDDNDLIICYKKEYGVLEYFQENCDFIDNVWNKKLYRKIDSVTWESIEPFTKYKQTSDFFDFIIEGEDDEIKKQYIKSLSAIANKKDSNYIADRFISGDLFELINDDTFEHINKVLWEESEADKEKQVLLNDKYNEYKKNKGPKTLT